MCLTYCFSYSISSRAETFTLKRVQQQRNQRNKISTHLCVCTDIFIELHYIRRLAEGKIIHCSRGTFFLSLRAGCENRRRHSRLLHTIYSNKAYTAQNAHTVTFVLLNHAASQRRLFPCARAPGDFSLFICVCAHAALVISSL